VHADFSSVLKQRVNAFLATNKSGRFANSKLLFKSIFMVSLYLTPIVLMYIFPPTTFLGYFTTYICSGIGMLGFGMGVMHDANHGSYWENKKLNFLFGSVLNLIGASELTWRIQHNTLHHTFTNIEGYDEDIEVPVVLRFSPNGKKRWIHNFQAYYFWLLYGLTTIIWVFYKDFVSLARYRKMGYIKTDEAKNKEVRKIIIWKVIYFSYIVIVPMFIFSNMAWEILGAWLLMHFFCGMALSLIFQAAHVMTANEFPMPDDKGNVEQNWLVHQIETTTNFAPYNKVLHWYIGGLNYQVEHHLFPNIAHIHYPKLSPIVKETMEEFGFEYKVKRTFTGALIDHVKMLNRVGRMDEDPKFTETQLSKMNLTV
jgi:linoleoyl-CoA desaturase